jgi:hypothetical protein
LSFGEIIFAKEFTTEKKFTTKKMFQNGMGGEEELSMG